MPTNSTPSPHQDRRSRTSSNDRSMSPHAQRRHHRRSRSRSRNRSHTHRGRPSNPLSRDRRERSRSASPEEDVEYLRAKVRKLQNLVASENSANFKSITRLGRGFRRLVHITDHPTIVADHAQSHMVAVRDEETVLAVKVLQEMNEKDRSDGQREELERWHAQERNIDAFSCFELLVPNLQTTIGDSSPEYLVKLYAAINKGAGEARSTDLSSISQRIGALLNDTLPRPDPPFITFGTGVRANRGIEHDTCLRLMLPLNLEDTDETFRRIRNPSDPLDLSSSFFARLFYPGFVGNPNKVKEGFLKSQLLVLASLLPYYLVRPVFLPIAQLYQAVFTSPSSASGTLNETRPPAQKRTRTSRAVRGPVASILHMEKQVTLRSIAYIGILAYHALTNASQWEAAYNGIDYTAMYNFIVDSFPPGSDRSRELLAWWTKQVFGAGSQGNVAGATTAQRSLQLLNEQ